MNLCIHTSDISNQSEKFMFLKIFSCNIIVSSLHVCHTEEPPVCKQGGMPLLKVVHNIVKIHLRHINRVLTALCLTDIYILGAQPITLMLLFNGAQDGQIASKSGYFHYLASSHAPLESMVSSCSTHPTLCHTTLSEGQIFWLQNSTVILLSSQESWYSALEEQGRERTKLRSKLEPEVQNKEGKKRVPVYL